MLKCVGQKRRKEDFKKSRGDGRSPQRPSRCGDMDGPRLPSSVFLQQSLFSGLGFVGTEQ